MAGKLAAGILYRILRNETGMEIAPAYLRANRQGSLSIGALAFRGIFMFLSDVRCRLPGLNIGE
jgi:hypothetical protein